MPIPRSGDKHRSSRTRQPSASPSRPHPKPQGRPDAKATSRVPYKAEATTDRLQKVLARAGVASRRAAEELITAGRVRVDGKVVTQLGTKADPHSSVIEVDGKRVLAEDLVYVVLHKPRNVVATMSDPEGRPTVRELLAKVAGRVYPVGRLDFSTSGVLLATNDGDFAAAMLHPRKAVPKTYIVKVVGLMEDEHLDVWRKGVKLDDGMTLPARVKLVRYEGGEAGEGAGKTWFELTITEGRNQQIRRMGDATGFRVMRLARLSFAGITSEGLPPGAWRYLTKEELTQLKADWGVPKRAVHPPVQDAAESRESRKPHTPRWVPSAERGGAKGEGRAGGSAGGGDRDQGGPRYGGGAPVRRDVSVTEDWGGGVKRGSSGSRDAHHAPRGDAGAGGRGGRTRTTGSGGGIGAGGSESSYRVKGRKGWA
jgi:23S rRNA pseudouridine2605 synthase